MTLHVLYHFLHIFYVTVSSNVTSLSTTPQVTTSIVTSSSSVTTSLDVVSSTVTVTTNVATTTIVNSTSDSEALAAGNEPAAEGNEAARNVGATATASAGPASVSTSVVGSENIQRQLEDFGVDPSFLAALPENIRSVELAIFRINMLFFPNGVIISLLTDFINMLEIIHQKSSY